MKEYPLRKVIIPALVLILLFLLYWDYFYPPRASISIDGQRYRVAVADEPAEWARGLAGPKKQIMLFVFDKKEEQSFWMKDMQFPIDIYWLNRGVVMDMVADVPVPTSTNPTDWTIYRSPGPIDAVLEIPVDIRVQRRINIERGEKININL